MRFAVKVVPLSVLGCAAALLVACGDRNGLLSDSASSSLQDALAAVQSACDAGSSGQAAIAARGFAERVDALPAGTVDQALIASLRQGASTLETLVPGSCTAAATRPATTATVPSTDTTTTTTPTTTTAPTTSTVPTAPTTSTTPPPPPTTPTTPPDSGGGTGPGNSGGAPGLSGGAPPGQAKQEAERP